MRYFLTSICLLIGLLAVFSCEDTATDSGNETVDNNLTEQIVFNSNRGAENPEETGSFGKHEIYRMNPEGTEVVQITERESENESHFNPTVSPGGDKIAFINRSNGLHVYTANIDGSDMTQLTSDDHDYNINPRWSPVDDRIAFASDRDGNANIYTINADGTGLTQVTDAGSNEYAPDWSNDGEKMAFASDRGGAFNLYVKDLASDEVTRLTNFEYRTHFPDWVPGDSLIAFSSHQAEIEQSIQDLFLVDPEDDQLIQLTANDYNDRSPQWSPDGRGIVFTTDRDGNDEIYKVEMDEQGNIGERINLSNSPAVDTDAKWDSLDIE